MQNVKQKLGDKNEWGHRPEVMQTPVIRFGTNVPSRMEPAIRFS